MDVRALHARHLFAAVVFVASSLVLSVQLITPSPVMVSVGGNGTSVAELGEYFRYHDVAVISVAAGLLGASGTYVLLDGPTPTTDDRRTDGDGRRSGHAMPRARGLERQAATAGADEAPESRPSDEILEARREEWEETAERLADNEREIYEVVLDADGVLPQSDVVDRTDLSKATVSRELDSLEMKNLLERKRRGMGNVVLLL